MTQEEYVAEQIRTFLRPQGMIEIQNGFWSLATEKMLRGITPNDLRTIICPVESHSSDVNIRRTFKVVMEEELAECPVFVDAFWNVVDGLSKAEKRLFLVFVTGVEMPPEPGTEQLIIDTPFSAFSKDEHIEMLSKLPQAHTCTNTLELPNYHDALVESGTLGDNPEKIPPKTLATQLQRVLGEKLRLAINESKGYELDAIEPASQGPAANSGVSVNTSFNPASHGFRPMAQDARTSDGGLRHKEEVAAKRPSQDGFQSPEFSSQQEAKSNGFGLQQEAAVSTGLRPQQDTIGNGYSFRSHQEGPNNGYRASQEVTLPPLRQEANGLPKRISPERMSPTARMSPTDLEDELMRVSPTEELLRRSPHRDQESPVDSVTSCSPVGEPSTSHLLDEGNRALRELSTPSPQLQSAPRPMQKEQGPAQGHASIDDFLQECDDLIASYQEELSDVVDQNTPSGRIVPTPLLT
jgi:hypothetical protein